MYDADEKVAHFISVSSKNGKKFIFFQKSLVSWRKFW